MRKKEIDNSLHKILPIEEMEEFKLYSFSYNPKEQHNTKMLNHIYVDNDFRNLMKNLNHIDYLVYREISKAPGLRVHYHGYIMINDEKFVDTTDFLRTYMSLSKICEKGSVEIDHINDPHIWHKYVMKQSEIWNNIGEGYDPLIYSNGDMAQYIDELINGASDKVVEESEDSEIEEIGDSDRSDYDLSDIDEQSIE